LSYFSTFIIQLNHHAFTRWYENIWICDSYVDVKKSAKKNNIKSTVFAVITNIPLLKKTECIELICDLWKEDYCYAALYLSMRARVLFTLFVFVCVEWSVFCFVSLPFVSCVPNVVSFSGLFISWLPPLVFSNVHLFAIDVASIILFLDSIFTCLDKKLTG